MYGLEWQTFVLQRRINTPASQVLMVIANASVFGEGSTLSCGDEGTLRLDGPFVRVDTYAEATWRAQARLLTKRRRSVAAVEVEFSAWSDDETQLLVRPRARRPAGWRARRLRRYFELAHRGADDLTYLLSDLTRATRIGASPGSR
jgi:hypothetical protein